MANRTFINTEGRDLSGHQTIEYDRKPVAATINRRPYVAPWTSTDGSTYSGGSIHIVFDKPVYTEAGCIVGWIVADEDTIKLSS